MRQWPFSDAPETIAVTSSDVTNGDRPVLYASHELDEDGDVVWQFHFDADEFDFASAQLVRLDTMVRIDPSLYELHSLPIGYSARRVGVGAEWTIASDS